MPLHAAFADRPGRPWFLAQVATIFLLLAGHAQAATPFEHFDGVTAPNLPAGWSAQPSATWWVTGVAGGWTPDTPPNAAASFAQAAVNDKRLISPSFQHTDSDLGVRFKHRHDFQQDDGGTLEISIDGGPWRDLVEAGGSYLQGAPYPLLSQDNPLHLRPAWQGFSGWRETILRLPPATGQTIRLSWRLGAGSASGGAATGGWWVDTIDRMDTAVVTQTINGQGTTSPAGTLVREPGESVDITLQPADYHHVADVRGTCGGDFVSEDVWRFVAGQDCELIVDFGADIDMTVTSLGGGIGAGCTVSSDTSTSMNCDTLHDALNAAQAIDVAAAVPGRYTINFQYRLTGTIPLAQPLEITHPFHYLLINGDSGENRRAGIRLSGQDTHRVLGIHARYANVELRHLFISNGLAIGNGGGILSEGHLRIDRSIVEHNRVTDPHGGGEGFGGGIYSGNTLVMEASTVAFNASSGYGGGIAADSLHPSPRLQVYASTVSNNVADMNGAGISLTHVESEIASSTLSDNGFPGAPSPQRAALLYVGNNSHLLEASIVANTAGGQDCLSDIPVQARFNVVESPTGCGMLPGVNGNNVGVDPGIGALGDNEGSTPTHIPQPGSFVLDIAACDLVASFDNSRDQRGQSRPYDVPGTGTHPCDAGAVEQQAMTTLTVTVADPADQGRVSSEPAGIVACGNTGGTCTASFEVQTTVQLVADPGPHEELVGWSGDCYENGSVFVDAPRSCNADFALVTYAVIASAEPAIATVACDPASVAHGGTTTCSFSDVQDGYVFTGWSGDCTSIGAGGNDCIVSDVTGPRIVQAEFDLPDKILLVETLGGGLGAGCTLSVDQVNGSCETVHDAVAFAASLPSNETIGFVPGLIGTVLLESTLVLQGEDDGGEPLGSIRIDGDTNGDSVADIRLSGRGLVRVVLARAADVTLSSLQIVEGNAHGEHGGGIGLASGGSLVVRDSAILGNGAFLGGGISGSTTFPVSPMTIERSKVSGNSSTGTGGGIFTDGPLTVRHSTISDNLSHSWGGGIGGGGGYELVLEHSTVSGNQAARGGGLQFQPARILHSTIAANSADFAGGIYLTGTIELLESVVADNTNGDCWSDFSGDGFYLIPVGSLIENNWNCEIVGEGAEDLLDDDPDLGPLADNGGPTHTHMPNPGSVLIDAIACGTESADALDQRGMPRGIDEPGEGDDSGARPCDIGAVEAVPYQIPVEVFDDGFESP